VISINRLLYPVFAEVFLDRKKGYNWGGKNTHTGALNFYPNFIPLLSVRFQMSAPPPAKKTAGLIEKETDEHRTSNIERRMNVFRLF
jgi:hypothetical protein